MRASSYLRPSYRRMPSSIHIGGLSNNGYHSSGTAISRVHHSSLFIMVLSRQLAWNCVRTTCSRLERKAILQQHSSLPVQSDPILVVLRQRHAIRRHLPRSFASASNAPQPTGDEKCSSKDYDVSSERELLYESPLAKVVTRLRTVSLTTGIIGGVGVPMLISMKQAAGLDVTASSGVLAVALLFVSASLGSTCGVHYIFSPYIYTIEQIPIRLCLFQKKQEAEAAAQLREQQLPPKEGMGTAENSEQNNNNASIQKETKNDNRPFLFLATTRSLFLTKKELVFDPHTDVTMYTGWRPLCNILIKGKPYYLHMDVAKHNQILAKAFQLSEGSYVRPPQTENPDSRL